MSNFLKIVMGVVLALSMQGCYFQQVESGEVGIEKDWGEIQKNTVKPGLAIALKPGMSLEIFNVKTKRLEMKNILAHNEDTKDAMFDTSVTILSKNGMPIPVEMTVLYRARPEMIPTIAQKYGPDIVWDNKIVVPQVRDIVREVLGSADIYELNVKRNDYSAKIIHKLNEKIGKYVVVEQVMIKKIGIPKKIRQSIEQKMQMKEIAEKARYEVERAKQEAQKRIAIANGEAEKKRIEADAKAYQILKEAQAHAKANEIVAKSITPQLIEYNKIQRWDGVMPKVTTGNNTPFLMNIKQ